MIRRTCDRFHFTFRIPHSALLLLVCAAPAFAATVVTGRITLARGSDSAFDLRNCAGQLVSSRRDLQREVKVDSAGVFVITEIPAGVYDLSIDARRPQSTLADAPGDSGAVHVASSGSDLPTSPYQGGVLARVRCRFETVALPAGTTSTTMNLGAFEITVPRLMTGTRSAPPFTCITMDGEEFDLSAHRGKYVLVEFWASWCGFCRAEAPAMRALHDEFGKNPRLVMIGLSLDRNLPAAETYVAQNGLNWPQGILGDWAKDRVSRTYDIREIPTMLLIGPDGRIIDKHANGREMRDAVARALAQP